MIGIVRRFDHAVIAVEDLNSAMEAYRSLGFDVRPGGRHTGRGTHNAIIRFGLDYLELLSVYDPALAHAHGGNVEDVLRYLELRSGGLLGYALATPDIEAVMSHWRSSVVPMLGPVPMERVLPDGRRLTWRLLIPGGSAWRRPWPFMIQWEDSDDERLEAEAPSAHSNTVTGVVGLSVVVRSAAETLKVYEDDFGLRVKSLRQGQDGARRARVSVGGFYIDLLEPSVSGPASAALAAEGEGLFQVDLRASDLQRALSLTGAKPLPLGDRYLVPEHRAFGARIVLVAPSSRAKDSYLKKSAALRCDLGEAGAPRTAKTAAGDHLPTA